MYLKATKNHWATDIEADGLLEDATQIWCSCLINCVTKEEVEFVDREAFLAWVEAHPDAIYVGHNFIAYDAVMLNRFWGGRIPISRIVDTFVLSQLYNPSMPRPAGLSKKTGPHSLEAWGIRVKYRKGEFNDFSKLSPEMLRYCRRDARLTALVFLRLSERMASVGFTEQGCELEHLAWNIIQNKQRRNGFPFDYKRAEELYVTLRAREEELREEIYKLWPPELKPVREYKAGRKRDGSLSLQYLRHKEQYPRLEWIDGPEGETSRYQAYDYVAFNLGSPTQRIEKLLDLGWKPTQFTKKTPKGGGGNPKVDEDSLIAFAEESDTPEVKALAKWIVVNSRANMLFNTDKNGEERGWLGAYNHETGAIHGRLFIASTLRYRHSDPNSANIPAVRLKKDDQGVEHIQYGEDGSWSYECRDLWTCGDPSNWSLVGIDGTGIQNRCLIHHLINTVGEEAVADFKQLALEGDVHKRNIEVLGLANKAAAKKFYYTLMMGGGGARLAADQAQFGTILTAREGDALKEKMIRSIPGFYELIAKLEKELERTGRIKLCDGTPIIVPSPHMVIPYLLQGDESRLMKKAMILVDEIIRRNKWQDWVLKAADIHDEWQYRAHNDVCNEFTEAALPAFPEAGRFFNYKIQIDGDAKIGKTWAETH